MRKIIVLISILTLAFIGSASAADVNGTIELGDGSSTVRISVGDDSDRSQSKRIRRLERAVRDLQNRVYELEDGDDQGELWTCKITRNSFGTTYYGDPDSSRALAKRSAHQKCLGGEMFASSCDENEATTTCEQ